MSDTLGRVAAFRGSLADDLTALGGFLRCETCLTVKPLLAGDAGEYTAKGWPKHCGYTMRWWTQRQVDAGEVPRFGGTP